MRFFFVSERIFWTFFNESNRFFFGKSLVPPLFSLPTTLCSSLFLDLAESSKKANGTKGAPQFGGQQV